MSLDAARYPRLLEYLASLPDGLSSYPECQGVTQGMHSFFVAHREVFCDQSLPAELRELARPTAELPPWLPDAIWSAGFAVMRDRVYASDLAMHLECTAVNRHMMSGPLYRAMFFVLSPSLAFAGASTRWSTFHRGTQLKGLSRAGEPRRLLLDYPPALFGEVYARTFTAAFEVAVASAGGHEPHSVLREHAAARSTYELTWS